jgi:excisionase family DNA binding protein
LIPAPQGADLEEIGGLVVQGGQDVAAIEAKYSMGGADDFSESAADATVRVARITQRDKVADGGVAATREESLLPVVDALPLVMAIWSERTI